MLRGLAGASGALRGGFLGFGAAGASWLTEETEEALEVALADGGASSAVTAAGALAELADRAGSAADVRAEAGTSVGDCSLPDFASLEAAVLASLFDDCSESTVAPPSATTTTPAMTTPIRARRFGARAGEVCPHEALEGFETTFDAMSRAGTTDSS